MTDMPVFRSRRGTAGVLLRAVFLLTIAAVAWQSFLTRTHLHVDFVAAPMHASHVSGSAAARSGEQVEARCSICEEIALSGSYMGSVPVLPVLTDAPVYFAFPVMLSALALMRNSPGWLSRAPPSRRQV